MTNNTAGLFKKSFNIVKDNPFITLYFVLYLIVLFLIIPVMLAGRNLFISSILGVLILLLSCAFMAGWFGMIKTATVAYQEDRTPEEKLNEAIRLKNNFFCSVSNYILPVIAGFVGLIALLYVQSYISDVLFGKIDYISAELSKFANDAEGFRNYLINMPKETWAVIFKKGIFTYLVCSFLPMLYLFWAASLYLNKQCSQNPFLALVNSIKAMFKKFFESILIFIFLIVLNFVLISVQGYYIENVVISFITMILRIYFAAYIIVLIFDLYEESQKDMPSDCCDRADCIRKDGALD